MNETMEAPTREMDAATVVAALDRLAPVAQRRVAKQALGRLLAPEPSEVLPAQEGQVIDEAAHAMLDRYDVPRAVPGAGLGTVANRVEWLGEAHRAANEMLRERDPYAVLAEARKALKAIAAERYYGGTPDTLQNGIAYEAASRGEEAVFNVLNVLYSYCADERAAAVLGA